MIFGRNNHLSPIFYSKMAFFVKKSFFCGYFRNFYRLYCANLQKFSKKFCKAKTFLLTLSLSYATICRSDVFLLQQIGWPSWAHPSQWPPLQCNVPIFDQLEVYRKFTHMQTWWRFTYIHGKQTIIAMLPLLKKGGKNREMIIAYRQRGHSPTACKIQNCH